MSYFMTTYMCRHCTSHFKRAMCISCRPLVDVHMGGGGSGPCGRMWTGEGGSKTGFFVDVINGWPLINWSNFSFAGMIGDLASSLSGRKTHFVPQNFRMTF